MNDRFDSKASVQGSRRKKARRSGLERVHVAQSAGAPLTNLRLNVTGVMPQSALAGAKWPKLGL